jgi:DNA processing protein
VLGIGREGPLGPRRLRTDGIGPLDGAGAGAAGDLRGRVGGGGRAPRAAGDAERDALAVLASVDGLGPVGLARLIDGAGSAVAVLEIAMGGRPVAQLVAASARGDVARPIDHEVAAEIVRVAAKADAITADLRRAGVQVVALHDAGYPARLRAIQLPPHVVFVTGRVEALERVAAVAIVGTRQPTPGGRRLATRIGAAVSRAGACVVSGLAFGIDALAHAAALDTGGTTVAVIGGGHHHVGPRAHLALARLIVEQGGAIVSEHAPDVAPRPGTFPRRNRIISGLADAVVVVEAGERSGALTTAAWALEQGRGCFMVPGPVGAPASAGCLAFLRDYPTAVRIVAGIPELIEDLGLDAPRGGSRVPPGLDELGAGERAVAAALDRGASTADVLAQVTGLPTAAVLGALTLLEARGMAVGAYGRYAPTGVLPTPERRRFRRPTPRDPSGKGSG